MPFYEYQCKSCGHDLEAMQKISDPPLKKCPNCGKSQLQRLMSAPVFRLKGGGWYETDFKGDQDNKRNLADRPDAEAPKDAGPDAAKDAAKDTAKDAAAGKDGNGKDAKTDAAPAKDATSKDKAADKPAEKSPPKSAKKPVGGKSSVRVHMPGRGKSAGKRPMKRPVHKAKRRV
ncbi:MAG TPA: FmdB family zinc ribbon protein [Steroidobacteraceae bacterium]|jgi:putative FmdB family regulatory protein|nr:FmdB family zinc ribbon protein [Steroidobacteraceae bacterium]